MTEQLHWLPQELDVHLSQPSVTDWAVLIVGYIVLGCLAMAGMP